MKILKISSLSFILLFIASCSKTNVGTSKLQESDMGGDGPSNSKAGVITAAEWNDLQNWPFWLDLIEKSDNNRQQTKWGFYTKNRFSVTLTNKDGNTLTDVKVDLIDKEGQIVFSARTDNAGKAELYANIIGPNAMVENANYKLSINNGQKVVSEIKSFNQSNNNITLESDWQNPNSANICFVIDATSSMADELKYLKNELYDVIERIKTDNPQSEVLTSAVFYKDQGDDYVTKKSEFSSDGNQTTSFIKAEETSGGGDFPEAVHSALEVALNQLSWSEKAKSRIVFLLLDAPPHNESHIINSLKKSVLLASSKGIKLIPILASGADKDTEFSMRFMAITTNGTFVFVTDDSKKGDKHYEPSVGSYRVEFLNNLMVRLVNANLR
jgi:hypothetical protein